MATAYRLKPPDRETDLPIIATDTPIMFEDEGQEEMGESEPHTITEDILYHGVKAHLAGYPKYERYRVFSNLNLHYSEIKRRAYVSPDLMVVAPARKLRPSVRSYRVGTTGPAPVLTGEVLSERSFQQQDLHNKPKIYSDLGVREYILVDVTAEFLPEKLLLKRLRGDRIWKDERDTDGGVTSRLGFRLII
ncbi:MAG: Uma2 family endonuclease, partial [Planctomycetes bacterium]|nr:Uma2 family endonuclease [Planctomycetota bacterium]